MSYYTKFFSANKPEIIYKFSQTSLSTANAGTPIYFVQG